MFATSDDEYCLTCYAEGARMTNTQSVPQGPTKELSCEQWICTKDATHTFEDRFGEETFLCDEHTPKFPSTRISELEVDR